MLKRFEVELLDEAFEFLEKLDLKVKKKVLQNLNKAKIHTDHSLFKKLGIQNPVCRQSVSFVGILG